MHAKSIIDSFTDEPGIKYSVMSTIVKKLKNDYPDYRYEIQRGGEMANLQIYKGLSEDPIVNVTYHSHNDAYTGYIAFPEDRTHSVMTSDADEVLKDMRERLAIG